MEQLTDEIKFHGLENLPELTPLPLPIGFRHTLLKADFDFDKAQFGLKA